SGESSVGPAGIAEAVDLLVALGLDTARQAAGEDGGLRHADPEGLCHLAQRAAVADHAGDVVLGGILPPDPRRDGRRGFARYRRDLGGIAEQRSTDGVGVELEGVADVHEGEWPAWVAGHEPGACLGRQGRALATRAELSRETADRVFEDRQHERSLPPRGAAPTATDPLLLPEC